MNNTGIRKCFVLIERERMDGNLLGPPVQFGKAKPSSSDEKAPDSSDNATPAKGVGWPKGKKRKKAKDSNDPQKPLSSYHFFMKDSREKLKNENPTWSFVDITRKTAQDWKALTVEQKQQYTDAAEEDKGRYAREVAAFKKTDASRKFSVQESKRGKDGSVTEDGSNFDIPIFTEEFLDHNKVREAELRQLRKSNTDYEQQNAALEKLIENTQTAISKLEEETLQQRCHNQALLQHLDEMRNILVQAFASMPLPGEKDGPTLLTIDVYMSKLCNLLESQSASSTWHEKVRDIVRRLDLHG